MLSHWQDAGFPGEAPRGKGPSFRPGLPPALAWSGVRWNAEDSTRVSCEELWFTVDPMQLLRGRLRISRISAQGLRIDSRPEVKAWGRAVLGGLADTLSKGEPSEPAEGAIRFELRNVGFEGDSLRMDRLVGWGWVPRRGAWEWLARVELTGGRALDVSARGAGSAGTEQIDAEFTSGRLRRVDFSARHAPGVAWDWRVSALDDGRLLMSIPPVARVRRYIALHGDVDFWVERAKRGGFDGEAHLRSCQLTLGVGSPWILDGTLCLSPDTLSLEDLSMVRESTVISGQAAIPVGAAEGTGWYDIRGLAAAHAFRLRGSLRRNPGRWSLAAPNVQWGDRTVGPLEVSADPAARRPEDRLRGELFLGEGRLSLLGGLATKADPLRFRLSSTPIESVLPLLPFGVPGDWTGMLRSDMTVWRHRSTWFAAGGSTLSGGRVSDVPLLAEAGALLGMPRQGSLPVDRVRARWVWADGRFWADSLTLAARELHIEGAIGYASGDSVLGLLRIGASGEGSVGKLLRLLGGAAGLWVGVSGDPLRPALVPVDAEGRREWIRRLEGARPKS